MFNSFEMLVFSPLSCQMRFQTYNVYLFRGLLLVEDFSGSMASSRLAMEW
jgi:hypothetical protein